MMDRRQFIAAFGGAVTGGAFPLYKSFAAEAKITSLGVLRAWYDLTLELVRHTATYSPPVASRAFAYMGLTAFEAVAAGQSKLSSLAGQLPSLTTLPAHQKGKAYSEALVLHGALAACVNNFFSNTGPTGKRAIGALSAKLSAALAQSAKPATLKRSIEFGSAIASHIFKWSQADGGADVKLMGFASDYKIDTAAGHWQPTSAIQLQQLPLLPGWGDNRTFAITSGEGCSLPPPLAYSEDKTSPFYLEALEVYNISKNLSSEQRLIARFWSDDPMLSPTPPGHWLFIALDVLKAKNSGLEDHVDVLARLGMAVSDAFVVCWKTKYDYDLLRPVTYIKKNIDKSWEPLLITPPFPEYPSGHSTLSGAAATVLTQFFGDDFAFEDKTHVREKFKGRSFKNFWDAANEAALSRIYGGIHFRAAAERGLDQGRCVGVAVNGLKTRLAA